MATETAKPFNGTPIANAMEFRHRNRLAVADCVDAHWGQNPLQVSVAAGGDSVNVAEGRSMVQGALYELTDGPLNLPVPANATGTNRLDYAVLTWDDSHTPGVYGRVLAGEALTFDDDGVWDMPLASWMKTPSGAITNLFDWRVFRGSDVRPCTSTMRTVHPTLGALAYEVDTDRFIRWNGISWDVVWQETGWIELAPDWSNVWRKAATCAARRSGSTVSFTVQLERLGDLPRNDPDGSRLVTLPAGMRPVHHYVYGVGQFTSGVSGRLVIGGDGAVWVDRLSADLNGGEYLRVDTTFLV